MSTLEQRRPVDVTALVMGVAFLGLAGLWLILVTGLITLEQLRFWLPLPWLLAGVAGLVAVVAGRRRRPAPTAPRPPEPAVWDGRYEADRLADLAARIQAAARAREEAAPTQSSTPSTTRTDTQTDTQTDPAEPRPDRPEEDR